MTPVVTHCCNRSTLFRRVTKKIPIINSVSNHKCTMSAPKVLITNPTVPKIALDILGVQCEVIVTKDTSRESILEKVSGVDALYWACKQTLDHEILDRAGPQMKTVAAMSAGINNIDVEELKKRNIKLGNTPGVLTNSVADMAILLLLGASRRLHEGRLKIEREKWDTIDASWMLGRDVSGSTVGIVGLGGIGVAIVHRLKAFQVAKFLYTGHREKKEGKELGAEFVSLDTLVKESDFVILSCPLTSETTNLFDKSIFAKMKKTSVLVNVSRGAVVDQEALIQALKNGTIFAAGLDVMSPEPLPSTSELLKLPNVVLCPHLGSASLDTRNAMAELAAKNILRGLGGEEMLTPVY